MKLKNLFCLLLMSLNFVSCGFISSFTDNGADNIEITSLTLSKPTLSMQVGSMDYISVNIKPADVQKKVNLHWEYDETIISCDTSSCWGITITGIKEGKTQLKCSYNGYDAVCVITVAGYAPGYEDMVEPYIYSNTTILTTSPGVTERVYVSLFGGTAADLDGYTWNVDNPSVCSINPTGQYCLITANNSGYTRIKITHNKSLYPYYIGVYVFEDATKMPYITTGNNVLTMNKDDGSQTISCNLINGRENSLDSQFHFEMVNAENGITPIRIESINNECVVTPITNGTATIRITHPDATYPLEILARVISVVKNVYIKPDNTIVNIDGQSPAVITSELIGMKEGEYNIDEYAYTLNNTDVAEIISNVGNQVVIKGKKNGSCKLIVSHPKAEYSREVLIIVNGQLSNAIDASCYITTDQNYIRTKIGADPIKLDISLKGGSNNDSSYFEWKVKNNAADGSSDEVIELSSTNGTVSVSRAASLNYCTGTAFITPKKEGTAVITLTNPIVAYPTEVLVKVYGSEAILEDPLYFSGSGIISLLNGQSKEYSVELNGNKNVSDEENISWKIDNSKYTLNANGKTAIIYAPVAGSGKNTSYITISHPKTDINKKVLVLSADTAKELSEMKALYSDKMYYNLEVDEETDICLNYYGFDEYNEEGEITKIYDFKTLSWTVSDPTVCYIEKYSNNPLLCKIKGLKAGTTRVTASDSGISCSFDITVYPKGTRQINPEVYFTTSQNVISIKGTNELVSANVSAINLSVLEYSNIKWQIEDSSIVQIYPNGLNAQIKGLKEGETVITVSHPKSQNSLKIYVRVGSEYIIKASEPICYISSQDVMTLLKDEQAATLKAVLVNAKEPVTDSFTFSIDNSNVAKISAQSKSGTAYIKPISSGQAEITISNSNTDLVKKVLVVVGNSEEELAGIRYLTTTSNVVAVGEGNKKNVSVSVKNSEEIIVNGFEWTSNNPSIVDVTSGGGASALLTGNGIGTAMITVKHSKCQYGLTIIAQCVDPIAAAENPYIQLNSSVQLLTVGPSYTSVNADLIGGNENDLKDFIWKSNDSSICTVYAQNGVGKLKAVKAGTTYITVSHPKSNYSAQLLVVCDNPVTTDCSISVSSSIMQLKPTDPSKSITATLINGNTSDKYNFRWSLDVYDVIDLVYSANQATITPKQTGTCTITISHPKSSYDQQIIVTVDEFTTFAFPSESITLTKGDVKFLNMQVPSTKQTSHIEYTVDDASKTSLVGTKSIAQLTACGTGTTIIRAKLIATSTGTVLANAECMVYVKEAPVNVNYISSASTIYTVNKGKSQTLTAMITGNDITSTDQYNFKWTSNDTDIIKVTGLNNEGYITGQSIYITAVNPGEAIITCSHPKAQSVLQFYVVVPGSADKTISLNKTYVTLTKGSSGTTLDARIENSTSSEDYNFENLEWKAELKDGVEICRVMGNGKTVTLYPVNVGETVVTAQLKNGSIAKCNVKVEAGKSFVFENNSKVVQPFHTVKMKYTVSPPDAIKQWTVSSQDDYFSYQDLGCDSNGVGYVEISGIKEGSGTLYCVADSNIKAQLNIKCAWDYSFNLNSSVISGIPGQECVIEYYNLNPIDAQIKIESTLQNKFDYTIKETGEGKGEISIRALEEISQQFDIIITAINPQNQDIVGTKIVKAKFDYNNLNVKIGLIKSDGNFSRYEPSTNILVIGDGEKVELKFGIEQEFANGSIKSVDWVPKSNSDNQIITEEISTTETYTIKSFADKNPDYVEYQYKILSAQKPVWKYQVSVQDTSMSGHYETRTKVIDDWKNDFYIDKWGEGKNGWNWGADTSIGVKSKTADGNIFYKIMNDTFFGGTSEWFNSDFSVVNNPSEVGKIYSEKEFKSILWYYRPRETNSMENAYVVMPETIWHCEVEKLSVLDETISESKILGYIVVIIIHNGKEQNKIQIPVYYEKRPCKKM